MDAEMMLRLPVWALCGRDPPVQMRPHSAMNTCGACILTSRRKSINSSRDCPLLGVSSVSLANLHGGRDVGGFRGAIWEMLLLLTLITTYYYSLRLTID